MDIATIEAEILALEQQKEKALASWQGKEVLGFKLCKDKNGFWQAYSKFSDGQQFIVYVGRDPRNAEEKIKAWLKRKESQLGE